jgi:hypothetical protein
MHGNTDTEIVSSLSAYKELVCEERRLAFADPKACSITINLRVPEPHQLVYLARMVAHLGYEESHFSGSYLWVTTWGVWSDHDEAIAFKTLEQFRRSYGENRSLEAAPGTCFRHDEFIESVCCLIQPMTVGWDAYYVPYWAYGGLEYFVFVSHDSFIDIEFRTHEMAQKALEVFEGHDWIKPLIRK